MPSDAAPAPVPAHRRRIWLRLLLGFVALAALLAAALVALVAVPALAPARDPLLAFGLRSLDAALPGTFTVESAHWPHSGRIELRGVRWIDGPDTLADITTATIDLGLARLARHDLALRELTVHAAWLDLAAVRERFPADTTAAKLRKRGWLRDGPLPGVPSFAIQALRIDAPRVRVDSSRVFDSISIDGSVRLLRGDPPGIDLRHLSLEHPSTELRIDDSRVAIDLAGAGRIEARGRGQFGAKWPFVLTGATRRDGTFEIGLARGTTPWRPGADGIEARGTIERDGWRARGVSVTSFAAVLKDIQACGTWHWRADEQESRVHAVLRGTDWLTTIRPIQGLPDSVRLTVDVRVSGPTRALVVEGTARGALSVSGVRFRHTSLAARGTLGELGRLRFALATEALDYAGVVTGELRQPAGRLEIRANPTRFADAPLAPDTTRGVRLADVPAASVRWGEPVLVVETERGRVTLRDMPVTGTYGDATIDARLDGGAGPYTAAITWPRPPEALIARMKLTAAQQQALRGAWGDSTRYRADLRGSVGPGEPRFTAEGTFVLPGPANLAALLPPNARVSDLGPLEGRAKFRTIGASDWKLAADLGATKWVDRLAIEAHQADGTITFDQVDAALPGVTARLATTLRGQRIEGTVNARVRDSRFLARFAPALDSMQVRAAIQGRIRGAAAAPDADIAFIAAATTPQASVPQLSGRALVRGGRLTLADGVAPYGAGFGSLLLDSLEFHYADDSHAPAAGSLPGRFTLVAGGSNLAWSQGGRVRTVPTLAFVTDSLRVALYDKDLLSRRPFAVTVLEGGGFQIDSLSLAGSMGTLTADGRVTREDSRLTVLASLTPPDLPPSWGIPSGLVPTQLDVNLRPTRGDSLELTLDAHGLQVGSHKDLTGHVRLVGRGSSILASLSLDGQGTPLLVAHARMPGRFAILAPQAPALDGPVEIDAHLAAFPLPPGFDNPARAPGYLDRGGLARALALDGDLHVRGTGEYPEGTLTETLTFPGWKRLKADHIAIDARLVSRGGMPPTTGREGRQPEFALAATEPAGITARIGGVHDGHDVLTGSVVLPVRVSFARGLVEPIAGREAQLELDSHSLPLEMFEPFTPTVSSLNGSAELHVNAHGAPLDPKFDAKASIVRLDARTPDRSNLTLHGDLTATGSLQHPVVRGKLQIDHGIMMLPQEQKLLHPTEGQALLWQGSGVMASSPPDDISPRTPPVNSEQVEATPHGMSSPGTAAQEAHDMAHATHLAADTLDAGNDALRALDLRVQIVAPGGTRVRGRGLDVELSGDITLTQRNGVPTLLGDLQTLSGGMQLYGRRMDIQKGEMNFYGNPKLDPTLDITLAKKSGNVDITAHVTGTAANPRIDIQSDPPLDQTDILSYVMFDRPVDNLDASQSSRIEQQASGQAEELLAAQFTGRISESLGLDLLSYERSEADSTGGSTPTVTLGKYLTPQILVKVEQDFSNARGFDVVLEYWIRRGFKLSTHAQETRSGVGLDWTKDY